MGATAISSKAACCLVVVPVGRQRLAKTPMAGKAVSAVLADESRYVSYTLDAVHDLVVHGNGLEEILDAHRRAEAKANIRFSHMQMRNFLGCFATEVPKRRRLLYRVCGGAFDGRAPIDFCRNHAACQSLSMSLPAHRSRCRLRLGCRKSPINSDLRMSRCRSAVPPERVRPRPGRPPSAFAPIAFNIKPAIVFTHGRRVLMRKMC